MATRRAVANGNWSSTSTWNGGVIPTAGDTVYASSFTVAIDQNVDIGGANNPSVAQASLVAGQWYQITTAGTTNWTSIGAASSAVGTIFLKNATAATGSGGVATALATITTAADTNAGAAAGGGFTMTTAYTLNADIRAGTTTCLTLSGTGNTTLGAFNIIGGSVASTYGFANNSTGITNILGCNIISGTVNQAYSIASSGSIVISGCTLNNNSSTCIIITGGSCQVSSSTLNGTSSLPCINNFVASTINISYSTLNSYCLLNNANGTIELTNSTINASTQYCILNNLSGVIRATNSTINASTASAIYSTTSGSIITINCTHTASNTNNAILSTNTTATNRFSGTFIHSTNGYPAINAIKWILNTAPTNSYFQIPLDGINANSFVRFYTADNALGQANPTDVRAGISYASGNLTGRLTVPAEGTVANGVTVGPNMPLTTATRSGTTATAFTAFPFPYQASDTIVVTGASNAEWNDTYNLSAAQNNPTQTAGAFNVGSIYAIASVGTTNFTLIGAASNTVGLTFTATGVGTGTGTATLSGSILTFPVPASYSASAGSGATAQTVGQAMLTAANIAAALTAQGLTSARAGNLDNLDATVSSRLSPSGTLATVTNLTNAPTVPTAAAIASQVRTELATELARVDVATSTRLATSGYTAPSAAPTVAAIRAEMDSNSTKLANLDATVSSRLASSAYSAAPTTAQIATAVEGSLLNEADGQAVLNAIVGAIGNTNVSDVALVAAIRTDLERTGGKIDSIPTSAAPTAAANATAVWSAATKTITGGTVDTLTNSPSVPSAASIASATRSELATELGRLDAAVSTRLATSGYTAPSAAPTAADNAAAVRAELATELARVDVATSTRLASSAYTAPSNSDVAAIKAKTDLLNTDRLAQASTVATTGAQIAAALS